MLKKIFILNHIKLIDFVKQIKQNGFVNKNLQYIRFYFKKNKIKYNISITIIFNKGIIK